MKQGLRACVYGQAVGDALGVPFEFRERGSFSCKGMVGHGTHDQPAGTWSDDTSMALAVCDSIRERGTIDTADIRRRFRAFLYEDTYTCDFRFDIGSATATALREGRGLAGEFDNGNGSLMRTIPLAFTDASDDDIAAVSAITHAHDTSTGACVRMVHAARDLIGGAHPVEVAASYGVDAGKPRSEVLSGGYVLHTYEAAIWCLANTDSYKGCVLAAVNLGDDTDTTAAVAGALAGIVYGYASIPRKWLSTLRGKDVIERCLF